MLEHGAIGAKGTSKKTWCVVAYKLRGIAFQ